MNPLRFFATLFDLHEPPQGEFPIGAWATLERPLVEEKATAPARRPNRDKADAWAEHAGAFSKA